MQIHYRLWNGTYLVELTTRKTDIGRETTFQFWTEDKCKSMFKSFKPEAFPEKIKPLLSISSSNFIAH